MLLGRSSAQSRHARQWRARAGRLRHWRGARSFCDPRQRAAPALEPEQMSRSAIVYLARILGPHPSDPDSSPVGGISSWPRYVLLRSRVMRHRVIARFVSRSLVDPVVHDSCLVLCRKYCGMPRALRQQRSYGVTPNTLESETSDRSSNPRGTCCLRRQHSVSMPSLCHLCYSCYLDPSDRATRLAFACYCQD